MIFLVILSLCFALSYSFDLDVSYANDRFKILAARYGKKFDNPVLEQLRKNIFLDHLENIELHNKKYKDGVFLYAKVVNRFTDMSYSEVVRKYTGLDAGSINVENNRNSRSRKNKRQLRNNDLPIEVDYRKRNMVTPVKDQGECGSCWSFASTGVLEAQYANKTGKLVALSEQQLVDCAFRSYGNNGCNGGRMDNTFRYTTVDGIMKAEDYPYTASKGFFCKYDSSKVVMKSGPPIRVTNNELEIQRAVANIGPVSIGIYISQNLIDYGQGIFTGDDCTNRINHAVLIVGYGTENGTDFWIVKNSWGTEWGEGGYVRMLRGKRICGITMMQTVALAD